MTYPRLHTVIAVGDTDVTRKRLDTCPFISISTGHPAMLARPGALADGKMDYRFVRVEATLRDVFPDEIDPTVIYFVLQDGSDTVTSFRKYDQDMAMRLHSMIGARLEVTGTCSFSSGGRRTCLGRVLKIESADSLKILVPPPKDDFDVPGIDELGRQDPSRIAQAGRCRTIGTVIATWGRNKLLIKDNWSRLTEVEPADQELPPCGIMAEVMGLREEARERHLRENRRGKPRRGDGNRNQETAAGLTGPGRRQPAVT